MTGKTRFDELKSYIRSKGWLWSPGKTIQYGEQIVVSAAGETAIVNYWPKRGTVQVQGQDSPLKAALQDWVDGERGKEASDVASSTSTDPQISGLHIGLDESGKGDWFGPLVVAAVYVDEKSAAVLRKIGVRDSKALESDAIQRVAGQIERIIPAERRHVWAVEPEEYNRLYSARQNINLLLADVYAQAARRVWQATQAQVIVCDQFSQRADRLSSTFAAQGLPDPVQQHHAESASIAVAAASILASAEFTKALEQLGQLAGLGPLPKGASDIEMLRQTAQQIIQTQGADALGRYAKLNFKPVQALLGTGPAAADTRSAIRPGPMVTIQGWAWQVQYHPTGFVRYTFADGGYLDWYEGSARGTIYVHGKPDADSVRILKPKTAGKTWQGDRIKMDEAVEKYIPRIADRQIASVLGVGWQHRDTVLGARFDFTDGGVLHYYHSRGTLSIQGTPSPLSRAALEALPNPFWAGLDELVGRLKALFPDWSLGMRAEPKEDASVIKEQEWQPQENALSWHRFWPSDRVFRTSTNEKLPCQKAMIQDWATVLTGQQGKHHLLAHAPTGLGKTLAALTPALAWVAQSPDRRRVYYLVNRVTQHENPIRELKAGLAEAFQTVSRQPLRVVDIVGRHLLCRHPEARNLPDICKRSRDEACWDDLPQGVASWTEVKAHLGHRACAYHTLQGLMQQAHVVICDYWWLFSQAAQTGRDYGPSVLEQAGFSPADSILIVDEVHNLAARVRAELDVDEPLGRVTQVVQQSPVRSCLEPVIKAIEQTGPDAELLASRLLLLAGGGDAVRAACAELDGDKRASVPERMLRLLLQPDESVVVYSTGDADGERRVVFRLVDPTPTLQAGYNQVYASLSMSGTLAAPADDEGELGYQAPLLGLPARQTLVRRYASPFPLRNQRWIYSTDTCGTFRERAKHISRYAGHIVNVGQTTPGVTMILFSSYAFLESVQAGIIDPAEQALIVVEKRTDAEGTADHAGGLQEYEDRLRELKQEHGRAYLFAVYKGKLAEGADFGGNLIKSVVCISIPLEYPGLYHERLQALYRQALALVAEARSDDPNDKAREYALDRLSLSLVLQGCGRGIRSEIDRCAFVLLDERYHKYDWRRFLQPRPYHVRLPAHNVASFYQERAVAPGEAWDAALIQVCEEVAT